ncbi:hemerythrin domain-containing protein [Micromonospora sp. ATA32]|nr:hemerythrin domain-containing protein [Micromonospora sp. ATA32]
MGLRSAGALAQPPGGPSTPKAILCNKARFEHLEAGRGDRRKLIDQVSYGRALHAYAEEVLYPALVEVGAAADAQEGRDEHQAAKELLVQLDHADPGSRAFERALIKLIGGVRHHIEKEEREFLPALRRAVGAEEMGRLGEGSSWPGGRPRPARIPRSRPPGVVAPSCTQGSP